MNKYNNVETVIDGIKFQSRLEATRYTQLKLLEKDGQISDLILQPEFQIEFGRIIPRGVDGMAYEKIKSRFYVADFMYIDKYHNRWVVEDTKGVETDVFKNKWDLVRAQYPEYLFRKITKDMI